VEDKFMEKNMMNLEIKGSGSSEGGKYNTVVIKGNGKIDGNLDCNYLEVQGHCEVNGNVKSESVKVNGNNSIKGDLEADEIEIHGEVNVDGNLSVEKIHTHGMVSVNGNCNAESFTMEGAFKIRGLLNAGELELKLHGPSEAREIGGEKIMVKRNGRVKFTRIRKLIMPFGFDTGLTTDIIEGDEIYLEYTNAKVVRGNDIELGSGCNIKLIEYQNEFKQHEEAEVVTYKKIRKT
jgi:cytoskeletal protein CcmA (bactofilin family)